MEKIKKIFLKVTDIIVEVLFVLMPLYVANWIYEIGTFECLVGLGFSGLVVYMKLFREHLVDD